MADDSGSMVEGSSGATGVAAVGAGHADSPADRYRRLGVGSAALLALALSLTWALSVPAFWGVDETSHVAYAVAAAGGDWPTIDTPNPVDDFPALAERLEYDRGFGRLGRLDIWTSNHPPLYFLTVGLPLRLGLAVDHAGAGLILARSLTALMGSAGVLAVAWLTRSLAPGRPRVEVTAAFCAALSPTLVHYAGQVYNDTLAFTLSTIGLAAGFAALRHGVTRRLIVIGVLAAGAGALTRSSGLAVAAVMTAAFMLAAYLHGPWDHGPWSRGRRVRSAVGVGATVGGSAAVLSGWAVLVNLLRYGDPTGAARLFEKFDRSPGPSWSWILSRPRYYTDQVDRFVAELSIGVWWPSVVTRLGYAVLVAGLVGGVAAGVHRWRHRTPVRLEGAWLLVLSVGLVLLLLAASAVFISQGGYPHSRYLLPGLGAMAALLALGVDGLPGARRGLPAIAGLCVLLIMNIALFGDFFAGYQRWYEQVSPAVDLPLLAPRWLAVGFGTAVGAVAVAGVVHGINGLSQHGPGRRLTPTAD